MLHVLVAGRDFEPWFSIDELPVELRRVLDFGRDAKRRTARAAGPGVFTVARQLGIVLPRCYEQIADEHARLMAVGHTLRTLRRYLDEVSTRRAAMESDLRIGAATCGDVSMLLARLEVALSLWADYRKLGPLSIATQRFAADRRGRIHWPRTLASTIPMMSGLDVAYADPVCTRHAFDSEHPITRLHVDTAEAAGSFLGARGGRKTRRPPRARDAFSLLDRYERSLFQDRQRHVAQLIRRYYAPSHRPDSGADLETTGALAVSFAHVWERMLFVALGSSPRPLLPEGTYLLPSGARQRGARLIPDLLVEAQHAGESVKLIVDAKDYELGAFPASDAINKQILYRLFLHRVERLPLERIGNAFLAPAVTGTADGARLQAVHDFEGEEQDVAPLGRIVSLELDFARVAAAYARGRADERLRAAIVAQVMTRMRKSSASIRIAP